MIGSTLIPCVPFGTLRFNKALNIKNILHFVDDAQLWEVKLMQQAEISENFVFLLHKKHYIVQL